MSDILTNGGILSDLREKKSTPSASNTGYEVDVQNWCRDNLRRLGIWNPNPECPCFDNWVNGFSFRFKEYAKKCWKGSFVNFKSAHKVWFDTPIKLPEQSECTCTANPTEENEVKYDLTFFNV